MIDPARPHRDAGAADAGGSAARRDRRREATTETAGDDAPWPDAARVARGFGAALVVPVLFWLDTLVALARGWRPPSWRVVPSAFAAPILLPTVIAIALSAALLTRRGRDVYRRRAPHLALASAAVLASGLVCEVVIDLGFDGWTVFHRRPPNLHIVYHVKPGLFPGVQEVMHYRTNSLGIRGPELPPRGDARRILCIGGSAVECVYLDDARSWPDLLLQTLRRDDPANPVWVGAVGISGFATSEHLQFLRGSSLASEIDDAVFLVGFNDGGRVIIGAGETGAPPLWRRSGWFLLAKEAVRRRIEHGLLDRIDVFGENIRQKRLRRQRAPKTDDLPDFGDTLRDYGARLREMVRVCRAKGVRPAFLTQPVLYDRRLSEKGEGLLWLGENERGEFVTADRLREASDTFNAALLTVCREVDVPCIDLSDMSGRETFFFDDCHFSEAGAMEVAKRLAAHFRGSAATTGLRGSR